MFSDLRPEALHMVIKTAQLLADLGETLALLCPVPFGLTEKLQLLWGWFKPQSGELQNHSISPLMV
jgi:ABC-type taurine transport system ATPase subunit